MSDEQLHPLAELARSHLIEGVEAALGRALESLMEEVFAERGCLVFIDDHHIYRGDEELRVVFPFSSKVVADLLEDGIGLVSLDPEKEDEASSSMKMYGLRSAVAASIEDSEEELLGILYCDNRVSAEAFTKDDLEAVQAVAVELAPALKLHLELRSLT